MLTTKDLACQKRITVEQDVTVSGTLVGYYYRQLPVLAQNTRETEGEFVQRIEDSYRTAVSHFRVYLVNELGFGTSSFQNIDENTAHFLWPVLDGEIGLLGKHLFHLRQAIMYRTPLRAFAAFTRDALLIDQLGVDEALNN